MWGCFSMGMEEKMKDTSAKLDPSQQQLKAKVTEGVTRILLKKVNTLPAGTQTGHLFIDDLHLDSLEQAEAQLEIEECFTISLDEEDVVGFITVQDVIDHVFAWMDK
jgi:acyl carrier protein